ncbi:hypothetical protein TNCV_574011 [Trichonephila clavipes]|nr:hypothetical protein TNCV_574011 [Trichonephila clavipes]
MSCANHSSVDPTIPAHSAVVACMRYDAYIVLCHVVDVASNATHSTVSDQCPPNSSWQGASFTSALVLALSTMQVTVLLGPVSPQFLGKTS